VIAFESILSQPVSREEFYRLVERRLAPQLNAVRRKAERITKEFPELKSDVIRQADMALQGLLILPGTGGKPYFIGNPPHWATNPVNDNEYIWGLNCMPHWVPLLRAFSLTGEGTYAQKVVDELRNWLASCLRPSLVSCHRFDRADPWRAVEAGIRMDDSWPLVLTHLLGTKFLDPYFLAQYAISIFEHGEVLYHISPQLNPNAAHNHYLVENLGLLTLSCLFPEFSEAEKWKAHAVRELERCAAAQITEEGGHIEGCPHYHNICMRLFVRALSVAKSNGSEFSREFGSKIEKGIDYSIHALRPSGTGVPWGDSDADNEEAIHAALNGLRLFHNPSYLRIVVRCCGVEAVRRRFIEGIWEDSSPIPMLALIDKAAASADEITLPFESWQKSLNQVMLRTRWSRDALSIFFACRSPVNNAQAHIDPMGFDFTAYGRPLIVDPGRFTYREGADRREFKSAAWHNTLVINGRGPFEYIRSWEYGPQKPGYVLTVHQIPGCKAAIARHNNYEPAIHFRAVAIIAEDALLVMDWIEGLSPGDLLQMYYHLDSTHVDIDEKTVCVETRDKGNTNVLIVPSPELTGELLPGRISDVMDISRPSTRLCLTASRSEETTRAFATVIAPWSVSSRRPSVSAPQIVRETDGLCCEFQLNETSIRLNCHKFGLDLEFSRSPLP